jgi:hypothetical protein
MVGRKPIGSIDRREPFEFGKTRPDPLMRHRASRVDEIERAS